MHIADARQTLLHYLKALRSRPSVLHVTSVIGFGDGFRCIRIRPGSPRSAIDRYLLEASRACSSTIITTAEILRQEPKMTTRFQASRFAHVFDYKPTTMILTRSGDIPLNHPSLLSAPGSVIIVCGNSKNRLRLPEESLKRMVSTITVPSDTTITEIVSTLKNIDERISIEAGPSTTNPLYHSKQIDATLLSIYNGTTGDQFVGTTTVPSTNLGSEFSRVWTHEHDLWTFSLYVRNELRDCIIANM